MRLRHTASTTSRHRDFLSRLHSAPIAAKRLPGQGSCSAGKRDSAHPQKQRSASACLHSESCIRRNPVHHYSTCSTTVWLALAFIRHEKPWIRSAAHSPLQSRVRDGVRPSRLHTLALTAYPPVGIQSAHHCYCCTCRAIAGNYWHCTMTSADPLSGHQKCRRPSSTSMKSMFSETGKQSLDCTVQQMQLMQWRCCHQVGTDLCLPSKSLMPLAAAHKASLRLDSVSAVTRNARDFLLLRNAHSRLNI